MKTINSLLSPKWPLYTTALSVVALVLATFAATNAAAAPPFKSAKKKSRVITDSTTVATKELHGYTDPTTPETEDTAEIAKASPTPTGPAKQADPSQASADNESSRAIPEYRIGPGDVLVFRSYNDTTISGEVAVRYDGYISLPLIPDIHVDNFSRDEATELVRESYASVFSNPQISLSVQSVGSKTYYVSGNVNSPREFAYLRPVSLIEAINNAGGLRINRRGGDTFTGARGQLIKALIIRHTRGERRVTEYDLQNLTKSGAHASDTPVYPGDTVYVPEGVNLIYFLGEVARPSVYELAEGMTMLHMLAQAGGPRWQTGRLRQVVLMREIDDQNTEVQIVNVRKMLKGAGDILLQPGDIIYVPQRHLTRSSEFVRQFTGSVSPLINLYTQAYDAINITDRLDSRILSGNQAGSDSLTRSLNLKSPSPSLSGLGGAAGAR